MSIKQQYYTSCIKSDRSGFQVKAESIEIGDNTQQILSQLIGYHIPYQADSSAIHNHPIAFRYFTKDNNAFLISSQSSGKDEFGRDGNFFAHSVISSPQEICSLSAPIFYWKSPFWISRDPSDISELPTTEEFDAEVTFDFDSIWSFLDRGNRRECLYKLLCAIIDYHQSKRKIIILDDNEIVAYWIACISMAFPNQYVQSLSFATYHHDPYTAPFIITGTTSDSDFKFTNDEYHSYFILNTPNDRVSEVPESDYAKHITQHLNAEQYDSEVLDFFYWLNRYEQESSIARNLDDYTNFRRSTIYQTLSSESPKAIQGTQWIVSRLYAKSSLDEDDIIDLKQACELIKNTLLKQRVTIDLLDNYAQALERLKEWDRDFTQTVVSPVEILIKLILDKQHQEIEFLKSKLENLYSSEAIDRAINQDEFLYSAVERLSSLDLAQILMFWNYLGKRLTFSTSTMNTFAMLVRKSFSVIPDQDLSQTFDTPPIFVEILDSITEVSGIDYKFIITTASNYKHQVPNSAIFEWVYYNLASRVSFENRINLFWNYWKIYKHLIPDLSIYELQRDLLIAQSISDKIDVIDSWIVSIAPIKDSVSFDVIEESINFLWDIIDRIKLSLQILNHNRINTSLTPITYNKLVNETLFKISISKPDQRTATFYNNIIKDIRSSINSQYQIIIECSLDLFYQELTIANVDRYFEYFKLTHKYQEEASIFIEELFIGREPFTPINHFNLVRAIYIEKHAEVFWRLYWSKLTKCLFTPPQGIINFVKILDYWFNIELSSSDSLSYFIPNFFMRLPDSINDLKKDREYKKVKDKLKETLSRRHYYEVIKPHIFELIADDYNIIEQERRKIDRSIGKLFTGQSFDPTNHFNVVQACIDRHPRIFWESYWSQFDECLFTSSNGALKVVRILDCWFNAKLYFPNKLPHFVPDFFMKLPDHMQEIEKNKEYKKIHKDLTRSFSAKAWYQTINLNSIENKKDKGWFGLFN